MKIENIPNHIGIIIDGNRRWAKKKGLPFLVGHKKGMDNVKKIGEWCRKKGVKVLTIFAFSTENWNRSKQEVNYLMRLLSTAFSKSNIKDLDQKGIKVRVIGQKERLSPSLQNKIKEAEEKTRNNNQGILNLAVSYGGKADIIQAIQKIIQKKISINEITEDLINQNLWTEEESSPDLIIRTGGEQRLSNFLLWQTAYSELYFTNTHWPEFTEKDLDKALEDYSRRQRRYGK